MPPRGRLPEDAVADLTAWIARGATWPAEVGTMAKAGVGFDLAARKAAHWAWKPVRPVPAPAVRDAHWPHGPIDQFVLARLEAAGIAPAPTADKRTLIRRATFDLSGLPPTAAEIDAFLGDDSADAFARVIDRLLASPHYGERWGRHWLDLMRYAETRGHEFDYTSPNAFQYRDYVIRALNADVPFDQFVTEHLAGDLLPQPRTHPTEGFNESILGTGFWFLGEVVHSPVDLRQDEADRLDNMIDVFSKAFLGLTVSCARCHDHKFDAISTKDYYALLSFVESSSYRQVRFDTIDEHRRLAAEFRQVRDRARPLLQRAVAEALRPGVEAFATKLLASAKEPAWSAALKDAQRDPFDPLYVWAAAGTEPTRWSDRYHKALDRWQRRVGSSAAVNVVVDYGTMHADELMTDDAGYRLVQPGDFRFGTSAARPLVRCFDRAAAAFDPIWNVRKVDGGSADDPGDLAKMHRPGRTLRTPSFIVAADRLYYLASGKGHAYASVNSHALMDGPLHRKLVEPVEAGEGFRWVPHDVSRYRGQRAHVEFSADPGNEFAVALVVQADEPPPTGIGANAIISRALGKTSASSETVAAVYQSVFVAALDALAADKLGGSPDQAQIIDWLLRHADLFSATPKPEVVTPFLAEQAKLLGRIRPESRLAPAMLDGSGFDERVFIRGSPKAPGEPAPRRFLEALAGPAPLRAARGSGRLELARQVTDPELDPLLARVAANRVWHHLFGRGIVASTDNFGVLGDLPTHPELLDRLAGQLVRDGWSLKRLIRSVMLSSAYQMSSQAQGKSEEIDAQNLLLHRQNLRRLEGEVIRDAMLAVSGRLDPTMFGPPVPAYVSAFQDGRGKPSQNGPLDGNGRRSIYLAVRRNFLSPFLLAFDTPPPAACVGRRTVSNVPAQALILLNDPFVHDQARLWARSALRPTECSADERINGMFVTAFARPPTPAERTDCLEFLAKQGTTPDDVNAWSDLAHALFNVKEFVFLH